MNKIQGLRKYVFSAENKYASQYENAYRKGLTAQQEIKRREHNPNVTIAEMDKYKKDLQRWEKEAESLSIRAKSEEQKMAKEGQNNQNGLGININFLA